MRYKNENKTLLILDLDETLFHATDKELQYRPSDFKIDQFYAYKRPFLDEFLTTIKEHFFVAVWSSASEDYVAEVVANLFPKDYKLEFVWARNRCTLKNMQYIEELRGYLADYSNPYVPIKKIEKVKRKGYSLKRILIVDDSPEKCIYNYGNAIYPSIYLGELEDNNLLLLQQYLLDLKDATDVRSIEKRGWSGLYK